MFDVGEVGFFDAVASAEEGLVGVEVVEAGPEGRGGGVVCDDAVAFCVGGGVGDFFSDDFDGVEPGGGIFDGAFGAVVGVIEVHEEDCDAGAFAAAEGGEFVGAGGGGGEGFVIMLGAPAGRFSVAHDLATEDAVDAFGDGGFGLVAAGLIDEGVRVFTGGDFLEDFHDADHRAVVEGDVATVVVSRREAAGASRRWDIGRREGRRSRGRRRLWRRYCFAG